MVISAVYLPFSANERPGHRKITQGVVTFAVACRFFFIQDGRAGLRGLQCPLGSICTLKGVPETRIVKPHCRLNPHLPQGPCVATSELLTFCQGS